MRAHIVVVRTRVDEVAGEALRRGERQPAEAEAAARSVQAGMPEAAA